jgi:myo-inositol catabolism protein IolC
MVDDRAIRTGRTPDPLYMLAFDHRQVLRDLYPAVGDADLESAKVAVLEALDSIPQSLVAKGSLGYLVDEEYGAVAARRASERGIYLAMPIEASRTPILRLQFPDDYAARFDRFNPQAVKALVFHNPADAPARKEEQLALLRTIGNFARQHGRDYLLEVLITPTPEQLQEGGGDKAGFRAKVFPRLLVESIAEMQDHGIEPDIWKVEGLDTVEDTEAVGAQATVGGREDVRCIVLGSGESQAKVNSWLANAAAVPAFSGFAIGRTVWHEPLGNMLAGRVTRAAAVETIADSFASLISAFGRDMSTVSAEA